jgi:hypothetical protein
MSTLEQLRRRVVLGRFVAYALPLAWMLLMLIKKLLLHMLALLLGMVLAVAGIALIWYVQDLIGWRP